jgi:hypothetical protein
VGTTNLFVELVVIGIGAFAWVPLVVLAFFGWQWLPREVVLSPNLLVPALSVVYLLGILTDRIADGLFEWLFARRLRAASFSTAEAYYSARRDVLAHEERMAALLEYGRSRMRICRGWTLNTLLTIIALNVFLAMRIAWSPTAVRAQLFANIALVLLCVLSWYSRHRLAQTEYRKLSNKLEAA